MFLINQRSDKQNFAQIAANSQFEKMRMRSSANELCPVCFGYGTFTPGPYLCFACEGDGEVTNNRMHFWRRQIKILRIGKDQPDPQWPSNQILPQVRPWLGPPGAVLRAIEFEHKYEINFVDAWLPNPRATFLDWMQLYDESQKLRNGCEVGETLGLWDVNKNAGPMLVKDDVLWEWGWKPQDGEWGWKPQNGERGWKPQNGERGWKPQDGEWGWKPQNGEWGWEPQNGEWGWEPQNGEWGWKPQDGEWGWEPQKKKDDWEVPREVKKEPKKTEREAKMEDKNPNKTKKEAKMEDKIGEAKSDLNVQAIEVQEIRYSVNVKYGDFEKFFEQLNKNKFK